MMSRPADLTLARLHLRLGSLAIARAELETLAGRDELDDAGLVDLAEARWRTGDIAGAGEVAAAILGDGEDGPLITLVVAAEAALARGRPTEARRYSTRAMEGAAGRIDDVFAGMPRGPVWPTDATTLHLPPPTLFDVPAVIVADTPVGDASSAADPDASGETGTPEPNTITIWDATETEASSEPSAAELTPAESAAAELAAAELAAAEFTPAELAPPDPAPPDPAPPEPTTGPAGSESEADTDLGSDAFLAGADALDRGEVATASGQLALALRLSPGLASEILEVIEGRTDRELAFVRGDAYRLVGRESDARRAFAEAVRPGIAADPPAHVHLEPDRRPDDPTDHDFEEGDTA